MKLIGFSTGAVAYGDFRRALALLSNLEVNAVELSALRIQEFEPLLSSLDEIDLGRYEYVSFHAPSGYAAKDEPLIVDRLRQIVDRGWPIILHPDSIKRKELWRPLSQHLCFENMDKRKPVGRTATELAHVFDDFMDAALCFDIGHAHQVDRTMTEATLITKRFGQRIKQIHISEVNTNSEHVRLSATSKFAFAKVFDILPVDAPVIIESIVTEQELASELRWVEELINFCQQPAFVTD